MNFTPKTWSRIISNFVFFFILKYLYSFMYLELKQFFFSICCDRFVFSLTWFFTYWACVSFAQGISVRTIWIRWTKWEWEEGFSVQTGTLVLVLLQLLIWDKVRSVKSTIEFSTAALLRQYLKCNFVRISFYRS